MQNDIPSANVSAEALQRKHESGNPPTAGIFLSAGLVIALIVISLGGALALLARWTRHQPLDPAGKFLVAPDLKPLARFPAPQLEIDPHLGLLALRAREDAELNQYGWVDRTNGVVRIPIRRAMELIAQRGLPASTNPPAPVSSEQLIQERAQRR
jgi:hypothetical protein